MQLFYTPGIAGDLYTLNEEESKHAIRVLRLDIGDELFLIDGKGGFYKASVLEANPKKCTVSIIENTQEYGKRPCYLHIALAPTKNIERVEWFLEKATEIGIDEITPLICQRSERREVKTERLDKIIVSAMKQSIKAYKPVLNEAEPLAKFISRSFTGEKLIAHCMEGDKNAISRNDTNRFTVLIGPEGDFIAEEVRAACKAGFKPITLGESRLRTETAALAACFEVNYLYR